LGYCIYNVEQKKIPAFAGIFYVEFVFLFRSQQKQSRSISKIEAKIKPEICVVE
jgi:hypothetical protein